MDERRRAWLAERRAAVKAQYDGEAPTYDAEATYPVPLQPLFVRRLIDTCPPGGIVLDAPCGTGRYFAQVTASGRQVVGIDQSSGMLKKARDRELANSVEEVGLQEMAFHRAFDASMTIDAMENVPPEDWPLVLANLHRAVRSGSHLYLSVEEIDGAEIEAAYGHSQQLGLPAVFGEVIEGDTAGYHYYPGRDRVLAWLAAEGLTVVDEQCDQGDSFGYRHWLVRDPKETAY